MDTKECETWQIRRIGPAATCRRVLSVMRLKLGVNRFGRSPDNDFYLDSKVLKNFISRHHANIEAELKENGQVEFVLQEKGLNGTFINDVRIKDRRILKEGDKITFGHTNGYKISPGQHSIQPHSEFQFIFERCPSSDVPNKRGLDSVEYHQTRIGCTNRKLPTSPDYDRSECCDNLDKNGALKTSPQPKYLEPCTPSLPNTPTEGVTLKHDSTVRYQSSPGIVDQNSNPPSVPDFMQEVEILDGTNSIPSRNSNSVSVAENVIEVTSIEQRTTSSSKNSDSSHVRHFNIAKVTNSEQTDSDLEFRDKSVLETGPSSRAAYEIDNSENDENTNPQKSNSRPGSAKSVSSYDECDGDFKEMRNVWRKDKSDATIRDKTDTCLTKRDFTQAGKILLEGRALGTDSAQESDTSSKRDLDGESNSMFSEDSDREAYLQAIHHQVKILLQDVHTDDSSTGKSSDIRPSNVSTNSAKKRKKKRFGPTNKKRPKVITKDDEKLEEGVEWYEVETCASCDCSRPSDRRVQWVQCDDCDLWFHTVCVGCRYDDVKDSQMEFHCGCV